MEFKDIIGLVFTFIFLVAFQFLGRPKKKPASQEGRAPLPPPPQKKVQRPVHKEHKPAPINKAPPLSASQLKYAKQISNNEAYVIGKKKPTTHTHRLFQDRASLKKAFIMQEIIKKPYE